MSVWDHLGFFTVVPRGMWFGVDVGPLVELFFMFAIYGVFVYVRKAL